MARRPVESAPQLWRLPDLLVGRIWARCLHLTVSVNRDDYPPRLMLDTVFATRLRVIYDGISVPRQLPTPAERQSTRARFGFSDRHCVVCYFGRLSSEKGVQHLLDALATLPWRRPCSADRRWPQRPELEAQATRLGLEARVRFAGFITIPNRSWPPVDLVAVPSIWYRPSNTVVEALAMQVPVVACASAAWPNCSRMAYMAITCRRVIAMLWRQQSRTGYRSRSVRGPWAEPAYAWVRRRYAMERVAAEYAPVPRAA